MRRTEGLRCNPMGVSVLVDITDHRNDEDESLDQIWIDKLTLEGSDVDIADFLSEEFLNAIINEYTEWDDKVVEAHNADLEIERAL